MIRIILRRVGREGQRNLSAAPKVFTLVATSPTIDLGLRAKALKASLEKLGKTAIISAKRPVRTSRPLSSTNWTSATMW